MPSVLGLRSLLVLASASFLGLAGCHRVEGAQTSDAGAEPVRHAPPSLGAPAASVSRAIDLMAGLNRCEVRHRGVLFDVGSPSVEGLEGWRLSPDPAVGSVEREGATWGRVGTKLLGYRFVLDQPQNLFVAARIRGLTAKSASVLLDGKPAGTLSFTRNQTRTVSTPVLSAQTPAGMHTIALRFSGSSRDGLDPFAEVDWLRLGTPDDDTSSFAAPTLADVTQERVAFQKVPHRSIALRAPSQLRCTLGIPPGARLKTSVGLLGSGEGEAEIRLVQDGQPVEVVKTVRVLGGDAASWLDLELPLTSKEGQLATLELAAASGARGARVLFGDPVIVGREERVEPTPRAKAVIVVVMTAINPARLPPWAPDKPLPTFDALSREGAVFERHRSPSTVSGSVMASLLTGLSPRQHSVEDPYARLPNTLPTLATVSRDASVRTAMFTANPATFEAFGFARGWDKFVAHSPVSPATGTSPIEDLITWLNEQGKQADKGLLAVVHTRGIHPPFDITPAELSQMPPEQYSGPIDPRRAGQVLERLRQKKKKTDKSKWTDADAMRVAAMTEAAMAQTDRSLSNLVDALRKTGLWNDTLLVVTSDAAAAADPTAVPFAEQLDLTEEALRVPLYVHFPGGSQAGARVQAPTTAADVARTALSALGIEIPGMVGGVDLHALAEQGTAPVERPLMATLPDRYAVRWGDLRLAGKEGAAPTLCDVKADPKCEKDLREALPLAATALFRQAFDQESLARKPPYARMRREPATMDADTAAAMAVWGR